MSLRDLLPESHAAAGYAFAYMDEASKREVRRALVKAVCIPGHQIPFASREMPVARGWGSGGLQVTLSTLVPEDTVKVIDQGADDSMNAIAIRELVQATTQAKVTTDAREATLIQTRHRIPEDDLHEGQVLVFQVPIADPLRIVDARPSVTRRLHADRDYAPVWLYLYEDLARLQVEADVPARPHGPAAGAARAFTRARVAFGTAGAVANRQPIDLEHRRCHRASSRLRRQ